MLDLHKQYWTSRGFAVLDVNYGGSTGYGRAYHKRLEGQWGIVDVDDCVLDRLIGPYPERRDLYKQRSPINYTELLSCPIIFFQGLEDKVVPPNQAELMVEALRIRDLPVAFLTFEGEQHGFRRSENIKRVLESEFYFYSRVFGFVPAD